MPLQHLGQLKPTMQQQIALQKALMALAREDEEIRRRAAEARRPAVGQSVKGQPALARSLSTQSPGSYAGPTSSLAPKEAFQGGMEYSPVTREPLARALAPSTGGAPDRQAEAWARREEIVEERKAKAKGLYDRLLPLDEEGRSIVLKAAPREIIRAMEQEGYISKEGTLAEPEKVNKPMARDTHVEDGWLYEDIMFEDGTSTHTCIGRAEEAEGATVTEIINAQKLGIDIQEHEERFYRDALKFAGDSPRVGLDMITEEDGTERLAEEKDVVKWKNNMNNTIKFFRESAGATGTVSMKEVKARYEGRPDLIRQFQQEAGLTVTGVWDDELEEAFRKYGGVM